MLRRDTARQLYILMPKFWIVICSVVVVSFAVSPAPGRGMPVFLADLALAFVCFLAYNPVHALLELHQVVLPVSLAKWASPQFESSVQISTLPSIIDEPTGPGCINQRLASKKKTS